MLVRIETTVSTDVVEPGLCALRSVAAGERCLDWPVGDLVCFAIHLERGVLVNLRGRLKVGLFVRD